MTSTITVTPKRWHATDDRDAASPRCRRPCSRPSGCARCSSPPPARRSTVDVWIAAVPVTWNVVPNGRDAIEGTPFTPGADHLPHGRLPRLHAGLAPPAAEPRPPSSGDNDGIPGPLIQAEVGDTILVHFKNLDTEFNRPHSMHFHGVRYASGSDGAFIPGFSGPRRERQARAIVHLPAGRGPKSRQASGRTTTTGRPCTTRSRAGCTARSRSAPRRAAPDREFVVDLASHPRLQDDQRPRIRGQHPDLAGQGRRDRAVGRDDDRRRLPHLPRPRAPLGQRRRHAGGHAQVGPAESFRVRWREDAPGTWLYHCHVEGTWRWA